MDHRKKGKRKKRKSKSKSKSKYLGLGLGLGLSVAILGLYNYYNTKSFLQLPLPLPLPITSPEKQLGLSTPIIDKRPKPIQPINVDYDKLKKMISGDSNINEIIDYLYTIYYDIDDSSKGLTFDQRNKVQDILCDSQFFNLGECIHQTVNLENYGSFGKRKSRKRRKKRRSRSSL